VIWVDPRVTYMSSVWLDVYVLIPDHDAVERRSIFVQVSRSAARSDCPMEPSLRPLNAAASDLERREQRR
jgi:hypothetical protein